MKAAILTLALVITFVQADIYLHNPRYVCES